MKLEFDKDELQTIIDALDNLPSAGIAGEMMGDLFGVMMEKKEADMTPEELEAKRARDAEREEKRAKKEAERKALKEKIEIIKAKIVLHRASL